MGEYYLHERVNWAENYQDFRRFLRGFRDTQETVNDGDVKRRRPRGDIVGRYRVPNKKGHLLHHAMAIRPPTFVFFCNDPKLFSDTYKRFMERQLRKNIGFDGHLFACWGGKSKVRASPTPLGVTRSLPRSRRKLTDI